jgi:hypothetical protein
MFCPQCATQNADGAKFCRSCGIELEAVALALSGKSKKPAKKNKSEPKTAEDWIEKRIDGVKNITFGTMLMGVSLLLGVALGLFVPAHVPWILIWIVFFGWMTVWGGISLADGLGNVLEAKSRLRLLRRAGQESATGSTPPQLSSSGEPVPISNHTALRTSPPRSITEGTTRQLDDAVEK